MVYIDVWATTGGWYGAVKRRSHTTAGDTAVFTTGPHREQHEAEKACDRWLERK